MEDAGLRDIGALALGEDGIWRAQARTPHGRQVQVSLDYRGDITMTSGAEP